MLKIRIDNLRKKLDTKKIDAALICSETNRFYFSKFNSTSGLFLISPNEIVCFINNLYYARVRRDLDLVFRLVKFDISFKEKLISYVKKLNIKVLGIEYNFYTLEKIKSLKKILRDSGVELVDISSIISDLRIIKDNEELKSIKKAVKITDNAFSYILKYIKSKYKKGLSEKDIAWELEKFMRSNGAEAMSFDPIIASGVNSAFPHHETGARKIKKGDALLLDFGCRVNGYCSDMSRTIFIGDPTARQKEVYNLVLKAQKSVLDKIKNGIQCLEVDKIARDVIDGSGYKDKFLHGTGHGVGLDIHEAPTLRKSESVSLKTGMTITVEPGIYLNKEFGVRIEDLVVVENDGLKCLSRSSKVLSRMII